MRVLLLSPNTERVNMVTIPLGLGLVAAAARAAGHAVSFLDLMNEPDPQDAVHRAIAATDPELVGISVRNIDDQNREEPRFLLPRVKTVVEACRNLTAAPIVLGGAGYSIFPAPVLRYLGADFGVTGDGEAVFAELLECLGSGADPSILPGVRCAGGAAAPEPVFDHGLDALPVWDEALSATADPGSEDLWLPIQGRRGCPNDCSYCATARIQGRRIRLFPPRRVAERVAMLARSGYRRFYFVDNSFNLPEKQALEISRALIDLAPGITWRCILYPQQVGSELVRVMAEAGCREVALGFESGSLRILREMNKRFTPEDVRAASDLLASHGIRRMGFLLLGGPGETRDTVEESIAFAQSLRLDSLKVTIGIRIYPGTALAARAASEGAIDPVDDLLLPRFYLASGLEPWIYRRVSEIRPAGFGS
jgi:radical SAM superfamily enzyme YgiQ (UPF0313 family)